MPDSRLGARGDLLDGNIYLLSDLPGGGWVESEFPVCSLGWTIFSELGWPACPRACSHVLVPVLPCVRAIFDLK